MTREEFESKLAEAKSTLGAEACILAQCTNKLIIKKLSENDLDFDELFRHGFDIRVFSEKGELHLFRASIDKDFCARLVLDEDIDKEKYYDQDQFLDIDTTKSDKLRELAKTTTHVPQTIQIDKDKSDKLQKLAVATGGGEYHLPISNLNDAKIKIRNFVKYDEVGRAYVSDWRIVNFIEGGK